MHLSVSRITTCVNLPYPKTKLVFQHLVGKPYLSDVVSRAISFFKEYYKVEKFKNKRDHSFPTLVEPIPMHYFDGFEKNG